MLKVGPSIDTTFKAHQFMSDFTFKVSKTVSCRHTDMQ